MLLGLLSCKILLHYKRQTLFFVGGLLFCKNGFRHFKTVSDRVPGIVKDLFTNILGLKLGWNQAVVRRGGCWQSFWGRRLLEHVWCFSPAQDLNFLLFGKV